MNVLIELGFSKLDIEMMWVSSIFTTIGGLLHVLMKTYDFSKWPVIEPPANVGLSSSDRHSKAIEFAEFVIKQVMVLPSALIHPPCWIITRLSVSMLTGLIVGLYFIGVFPSSLGGIARISILCIFIGYQAPTLWFAKERWVLAVIESDVFKEQLSKAIKKASDDFKAIEKENGNTP